MPENLTVGYWNIRGLVEPIHMILEYLGISYEREEFRVIRDDRGEYQSDYMQDRSNKGLLMPNLPYLFEGDFKLTQSSAITRHFGRRGNLCGMSDDEEGFVNMLIDTIKDHLGDLGKITYMGNFLAEKHNYLNALKMFKLPGYEKLLEGKKYLTGEKLSVADFWLWTFLDYQEVIDPKVLDGFPNLVRFKADFAVIPQIKDYLESDKFKRVPIFSNMSQWGGARS